MMVLSPSSDIFTYFTLISASLLGVCLGDKNSEMARVLHRPIRALSFPETSTMGIFFALAVPLEAPRNSVSLSYFFEATYNLPINSTGYEHWNEKRRKKRGIDRTTIYRTVENQFERFGLPGQNCLLRTICETSEASLHHNGVIGDIIHVVFTPSTSTNENLPPEVHEAELFGRAGNCEEYHSTCPVGLFDLIGILGETGNVQFWMSSIILWCSLCWVIHGSRVENVTYAVTNQIRSAGFPEGSGMGIFFAVSVPVDISNKAVSVSFYFEANYRLPSDDHSSQFEDYIDERSLDRRLAYEIIEKKLERAGYPGRVCLMRAICGAANNPITENGLLGDLLHILLTPSSSKNDKVPDEVEQAEYEKDCNDRYSKCPVNVLDLISHYI